MPIQIIDNFNLTLAKPIDNRFVVGSQSFYTTKDSIGYKYPGMRIWDLNDGIPYVWTGTTFSSENSVSISGSGTPNYLAKFSSSNVIDNSLLFDNGTNIGISEASPAYKLDVGGVIRAQSGFIGDGSLITNINASSITSGNLGLSRIQLTPGAIGNILLHAGGSAQWVSPSSLSVGTASALQTTRTIFGQNFNGTQNVTGPGTFTDVLFGTDSLNRKATLRYSGSSNIILTVPLGSNRTFAFLEQAQTFSGNNTFSGANTFSANNTFSSTNTFRFIRTNNENTTSNDGTTYPLRVGFGQYLSFGGNESAGGLIQTFSTKDLRINLQGNNVIVGDFALASRPKLGINSQPSHDLHLGYDSAFKPTTNTWTTTSDIRLKENIIDADLDRCLYIVDNLPLKKYRWMDKYYTDEQVSDDRNKLGWIADEVQEFFPKGVKIIEKFDFNNGETIEKLKTLNTDQIYAVLYGAVKKLSQNNKYLIDFIKESNDLSDLKNKINQFFQTTN